eukprot:10380597-Prorocentrum_lima.AAC.1
MRPGAQRPRQAWALLVLSIPDRTLAEATFNSNCVQTGGRGALSGRTRILAEGLGGRPGRRPPIHQTQEDKHT